MNAFGRKEILISSSSVFGLAGICKASAGGAAVLTVGRFLGGIAAGTAAVIVPIYINEMAPPNYKVVQSPRSLSVGESCRPRFWEFSWNKTASGASSCWLGEDVEQELADFHTQHAGEPEGTDGTEPVGESDPLLEHLNGKYAGNYSTSSVGDNDVRLEAGLNREPANREIGLLQLLTKKEYRAGFIVVAGLMLALQLTGINAVVF